MHQNHLEDLGFRFTACTSDEFQVTLSCWSRHHMLRISGLKPLPAAAGFSAS